MTVVDRMRMAKRDFTPLGRERGSDQPDEATLTFRGGVLQRSAKERSSNPYIQGTDTPRKDYAWMIMKPNTKGDSRKNFRERNVGSYDGLARKGQKEAKLLSSKIRSHGPRFGYPENNDGVLKLLT